MSNCQITRFLALKKMVEYIGADKDSEYAMTILDVMIPQMDGYAFNLKDADVPRSLFVVAYNEIRVAMGCGEY